MPKYILILGSPRKGNTDYILSEIFNKLGNGAKLVFLRDLKINFCKGCLACYETGKCVQADDMEGLFQKLLEAKLIILGSPLYYGNVSALTKNFIDRTIPAYDHELLKNKKIISIMVGGGDTATTEEFHKEVIRGFVKYNKLNLIKRFNFQGFEADDLLKEQGVEGKISEIVELIKECDI